MNELASGNISDDDWARTTELLGRMRSIFHGSVVGQEALGTALITSLIARGHVLLESVPGLAKTTAALTLAASISATFSRIQCTPDLMPNDIVGTQIYSYETGAFTTQLGPVHAHLVLLDEINRSSAKTQSAMLEAMQERQTSIGGTIYKLPDPFMVMATQNPIDESVKRYVVALINTTRGRGPRPLPELQRHLRVGSSPRGGLALMQVGQALALQAGRNYVTPEDIAAMRHQVLRHRLVRTYDALANNVSPESLIDAVFQAVPTP